MVIRGPLGYQLMLSTIRSDPQDPINCTRAARLAHAGTYFLSARPLVVGGTMGRPSDANSPRRCGVGDL